MYPALEEYFEHYVFSTLATPQSSPQYSDYLRTIRTYYLSCKTEIDELIKRISPLRKFIAASFKPDFCDWVEQNLSFKESLQDFSERFVSLLNNDDAVDVRKPFANTPYYPNDGPLSADPIVCFIDAICGLKGRERLVEKHQSPVLIANSEDELLIMFLLINHIIREFLINNLDLLIPAATKWKIQQTTRLVDFSAIPLLPEPSLSQTPTANSQSQSPSYDSNSTFELISPTPSDTENLTPTLTSRRMHTRSMTTRRATPQSARLFSQPRKRKIDNISTTNKENSVGNTLQPT